MVLGHVFKFGFGFHLGKLNSLKNVKENLKEGIGDRFDQNTLNAFMKFSNN